MASMKQAVEIPTSDGTAEGFIFRDNARRHPGVLYLTDIGGIREANLGMASRLAEQGYTVLVPNLFYRTSKLPVFNFHPDFREERTMQRVRELGAPLTPDAMNRDSTAYVNFLASSDAVAPGPTAVVGFCWSGAMAIRAAAVRPEQVAAAASFHAGRLYTDDPSSPHRQLPWIKARLYFGHAVNDKGMLPDAIAKLEDALKAWGGQYESETYEGALHSWTVTDSPVYNHAQAERAFGKLTHLLAETLK
jgi:carboxymethylenebutenolidase